MFMWLLLPPTSLALIKSVNGFSGQKYWYRATKNLPCLRGRERYQVELWWEEFEFLRDGGPQMEGIAAKEKLGFYSGAQQNSVEVVPKAHLDQGDTAKTLLLVGENILQ